MKFGKRLAAETGRHWQTHYIDYKACKRAIQQDVLARDARGCTFEDIITQELHKANNFYLEYEAELEALMQVVHAKQPAELHALRVQVNDLRKFAVLNYVAVVKGVKKRNRHLQRACGGRATPMVAVQLLSQQPFFTSTKLAALSTQADLLAEGVQEMRQAGEVMADYECPICLSLLHAPVVLSCAHRFCWGCLLAYCATQAQPPSASDSDDSKNWDSLPEHKQQLLTTMDAIYEPSGKAACAAMDCPVCRKPHLLDLDQLQVDPHLNQFVEDLKRKQEAEAETDEATLIQADDDEDDVISLADAAVTEAMPEIALRTPSSSSSTASSPLPILAESLETEADSRGSGLQAAVGSTSDARLPAAEAAVTATAPQTPEDPPLLPPQAPHLAGRLTVVLDLDGTLVSTYTPKRAPRLPPGTVSFLCGQGSKLNPNGVMVIERPGLQHFLARLSGFAEVVVFTAGLHDYAAPILDAIQAKYSPLNLRLFREATSACPSYPCVKDLSRLGRPANRVVLLDDTPLAFLRQPDNGIPVLTFRGDVDDRVLLEAMLPLLETLAAGSDVRPVLHSRFDMQRWFASQGIVVPEADSKSPTVRKRLALPPRVPGPAARQGSAQSATPPSNAQILARRRSEGGSSGQLLLCDFDNTLTDFDAGERLVGQLAPELAPMLASLQMPANFVPLTNAVLSEMARRGITRDKILATLREMGREFPPASISLMRWAERACVDVRILSDCNSVFINAMLVGAKANHLVKEVITNGARFEQVPAAAAPPDWTGAGVSAEVTVGASRTANASKSGPKPAGYRLAVQPWHDAHHAAAHGCKLCPENLCKGTEVLTLRRLHGYSRLIYCGDGANDLCPALNLGASDVLLARRSSTLHELLSPDIEASAGPGSDTGKAAGKRWPDGRELKATVHLWSSQLEMAALAQQLMS